MCGIIGIVSRPSTRETPPAPVLLGLLDAALAEHGTAAAAAQVARCDALLKGVPGVLALSARPDLVAAITARLDQLEGRIAAREQEIEAAGSSPDDLETANAELIALRDAVWAIRQDRLRTAQAVGDL